MNDKRKKEIRIDTPWFRFLNSALDAASNALLSSKRMTSLDAAIFDTRNIAIHEGLHRIVDPRYKEWWYYDIQLDDGTDVSMSVVFSIVRTHWFVWVYNPAKGEVSEEIMEDGPVRVNAWGGKTTAKKALSMTGPNFSINGSFDQGYLFEFHGRTLTGLFHFRSPVPGRAENHKGVSNTRYGLYQVPKMDVSGTLKYAGGTEARRVSGVGYHDHWWCIAHRVTRWNWMQAKFPGGWALSVYDAAYGYRAEDHHRYGWIFTPAGKYEYFNTESMDFQKGADGWTLAISGLAGSLRLEARSRVERYEYKPVALAGLFLGEVQYFQYPVSVKAIYTPVAGVPVPLKSGSGILEWDWLAVW
jgi:hypothetical protein